MRAQYLIWQITKATSCWLTYHATSTAKPTSTSKVDFQQAVAKYIFLAFQVKSDQEFTKNSVLYLFAIYQFRGKYLFSRPLDATIREVKSHLCFSSCNISDFLLHTSWVHVFVSSFASNIQVGTLKSFLQMSQFSLSKNTTWKIKWKCQSITQHFIYIQK